jgi:hypothetical protein
LFRRERLRPAARSDHSDFNLEAGAGGAACVLLAWASATSDPKGNQMKSIILWLLGVPISIIILLNIFGAI